MKTAWKEPKLEDLLADPILDVLLAHDRISRDDLRQVVEQARRALALAPRAGSSGGGGLRGDGRHGES